MIETDDEPIVALVDRGHVHEIMTRARTILWDVPEGSLTLDKFMETYKEHYNTSPNLEIMKKDLEDIVIIDDDKDPKISLVPLQFFARDLLTLLHEAGGRMNLTNFDTAFVDRFGKFILKPSHNVVTVRYSCLIFLVLILFQILFSFFFSLV
ncbi:hypothetical protein E2C01_085403 [Portunus trituberculatus]|uniref:Uncharacterized protein n=1 Tax=Portunus trituberculatus TaxID=210409 RepID=A0A5B7J8S4_PORTR|nr:hypothetical protein [Portunus trituberculatus]